MGQFSSKFSKKENNIDISLYPIPKLHKSIFKYYKLDLFHKIMIGSQHIRQITWESPAGLSDSFPI